jgi:hypothetical protein
VDGRYYPAALYRAELLCDLAAVPETGELSVVWAWTRDDPTLRFEVLEHEYLWDAKGGYTQITDYNSRPLETITRAYSTWLATWATPLSSYPFYRVYTGLQSINEDTPHYASWNVPEGQRFYLTPEEICPNTSSEAIGERHVFTREEWEAMYPPPTAGWRFDYEEVHAYDGILGIVFLCAPGRVFEAYGTTPPNHPGYVQFPAALLIIFAIMFAMIARDPVNNRRLIPYGILLKLSYCGIVLLHWLDGGIPGMWKPFAIFDLVFLVLFALAFAALGKSTAKAE